MLQASVPLLQMIDLGYGKEKILQLLMSAMAKALSI